MDDVRRAALERASRAKKAPVGTSFESERQRSKNALVKQISSQDGRNVRMIAAATEAPEEERILRVAAYCRVSTDDIDQKLSIQLQIQQYTKKIKKPPFHLAVRLKMWYSILSKVLLCPNHSKYFSLFLLIRRNIHAKHSDCIRKYNLCRRK